MLHLKEEGRQLLQSILVTSLISKETCWTALIQTEDIDRVMWVDASSMKVNPGRPLILKKWDRKLRKEQLQLYQMDLWLPLCLVLCAFLLNIPSVLIRPKIILTISCPSYL